MQFFSSNNLLAPQGLACRQRRSFRLWWLWLTLLALLYGCAPGPSPGLQQSYALARDEALVSIYLETDGFCTAGRSLSLDHFNLHSGDETIQLFLDPVTIACNEVQGRQILLGLAKVSAGFYDQISLTVNTRSGAVDASAEQNLALRFSKKVVLAAGDSSCLFVTWHLDQPSNDSGVLLPEMSARGQVQPLSRDLLYVLCSELNTLYVVRTDTRFVTAAIGLDGVAGEIEVDTLRQRLYLVNSSRRSLQAIDLPTQRVVDNIPLPLTLDPFHLTLDVERNVAYVSDPVSRRVLGIELDDGQITANRQIGLRPGRLIYIAQDGGGLVAVSAPLSQNVHLLDSETLMVRRSLATGLRPRYLLSALDQLYVAEEGSRTITVFNLFSGQQLGQIILVASPGEILASPLGDKAYISLSRANSLGVITPGQFTSLRSIPAGEDPAALALSERRGQIYVANTSAHSVTILDRVAETIISTVPVGGRVTDLAVFE